MLKNSSLRVAVPTAPRPPGREEGKVPLFLFSPHFDVICDLLLDRRTATWNLFVNRNTELARAVTIFRGVQEVVL